MVKDLQDKYLGLEKYNNQGYLMKIIKINKYSDIEVEFEEPYHCIVKNEVGHFLNGGIRNPYAPTVYGVGIVGMKYPISIKGEHKGTKEYNIWYSMLRRCYSSNYKQKFTSYINVSCDPIWLYYENFYEWMHNQTNYEIIKNENFNLDKDILVKGNTVYSPERCTLVPQNVNKLLTKNQSKRGNLPIGVIYDSKNGYYGVYCNDGKKQIHLNNYKSKEDAFLKYKDFKEKTIKRIAAEEYNRGSITEQCYNALLNYRVEITD